MLLDGCLGPTQRDDVEAGRVDLVELDLQGVRPGCELTERAANTGIENSIRHDLHAPVDMSEEDAPQTVTCRHDGPVEIHSILEEHVLVEPFRVKRKRWEVYEDRERPSFRGAGLPDEGKLSGRKKALRINLVGTPGIQRQKTEIAVRKSIGENLVWVCHILTRTLREKPTNPFGPIVVSRDEVDRRRQSPEHLLCQHIAFGAGIRNNIPGVNDEVRRKRKFLNRLDEPDRGLVGVHPVEMEPPLRADMCVAYMDKPNEIFHNNDYRLGRPRNDLQTASAILGFPSPSYSPVSFQSRNSAESGRVANLLSQYAS